MLFEGHVPGQDMLKLSPVCSKAQAMDPKLLPPPTLQPICDYNMKHFFSFKNGDSFMFDPRIYPDVKKGTVEKLKADIIESARNAGFKLRREGKARNRINFRCDHNKIIPPATERIFETNKHQQSGTKIATARSSNSKADAPSKTTGSSNLACTGKNKHKKKRISSTGATCEKDKCPFQLTTVFCNKEKAWFLRSDCRGNIEDDGTFRDPNLHKGHFKVSPDNVKTDIITLSKKEIDLALQCQSLYVNNQTVSDLLELQRGGDCRFSSKQMAYLKAKTKANLELESFSAGKSTAEKLLKSFDRMIAQGDDISYVALTHSYKDGFRISHSKGRPRKVRPGECKLFLKKNLNLI